ncbi:sulfatase family protein [Halomarina ordinaria]|uniref:Sulfatase n=1 Tax=Halomarina ordinaria TaxID=3033939 RepID=A0ABD5UGR0_9EURY|nr:sulfatase-like hydrolase/transferase [Halomarina sp. PSRA2]
MSADAPGTDGEREAPPNLLVVCVDCLREDVLRTDRTVTPFLDDLRERGLACTELYATATTTTPCVASLLTGTYSERNGLRSLRHGELSADVRSLAELLSDAGYHTEAHVTGPLLPETGLDRGFDVYRHRPESASVFGSWGEEARARLADLTDPFAAVVHLWELHEDVEVPDAYDRPRYGATPYARALSALDPQVRSLVDVVPDDTLVAVVGDHGESITHRHNPVRLLVKSLRDALRYYGGVDTRPAVNRLNRALDGFGPDVRDRFVENGHGENVLDATTNVPFVLAGPGVEAATVDAQVRQVDVLPTLLDALDLPVPAVDGEPIRADSEERPAYMRACGASLHGERNWARGVRLGGAKYVEYPNRDWSPEVYDLRADPRELTPVDDPALAARLERELPPPGRPPADETRLDIDDHLRDLGYL